MEPTSDAQPASDSLGAPFAADELLETLPWGVLVVDEQRIIRRVNQQAARWCGAAPTALLGQPLAEAALPAGVGATLLQLLEPAAPAAREVFLPRADQWIALSATRRPGGWVLYGQDVTPQKRREQQYQALAENTPDVLARWTPDLRLRYANAAFAARVGQPMSTLLGRPFAEMGLATAVTDPYVAALQRVFATGQPQDHYQPFPTADGGGECYVRLVPELRDGEIETVLGIAHDVTTLRQAEQAAQQSHALLQSVFEAVPHSVVVLEAVRDEQQQIIDFRHLLTNGVADRHMGLELQGRLLRHLLPGYLDAENFRLLVETVETGQPNERTQYYDSFGGPLWLHSRYRKLGEWVVLSHENITARRQAEAEALRLQGELARRAHDHYHALFHAMDEGFCVLEMLFDSTGQQAVDFRYLELNPAFARQSGMPADAQGKTARELLPDLEPFWFDTYGGVARTGEAVRVEHYVEQVDRWFDVHAFRLGAPEAHQIAVLFNDITARKQAETLLRHAAAADAFRLRLADALGPLTDPVLIQEAVTRLARLHFGADRCYYCELEGGQAIIRRDAAAEGLPSVAGTYPMADFALLSAVVEAGRPFIVRDVRRDESVDANLRELCVQLQVISYLDVPVIKNGRPVGVLCLVQRVPREWTAAEVALTTEVAERAWTAVERARTEEALRASEARLQSFVQASSDALYRMTADWTQLLSLEGRNFLADTSSPSASWLATYVPTADQAVMRAAIEAAIAGQHFFELEHRVMRADGSVGWTFSRAVPVLNERGELAEWFGAATDITARKQAEERLRSSEEHLSLALQAGRMGSFEWTSEGRRLRLSPTSEQVLGLLPGAAPATSDAGLALVHPDDRPRHQAVFERASQRGENFHSIYRIVRPRDGQVRWIEERGQGTRDPATGIVCLRGVHWDVTEQVRTQRQLAEFNAQLEQRVARRTHALQASYDLLQSVFDTNLIAMSVMEAVRDEDGTVQDFRLRLVSRELARATGRTDLEGTLYAQEYPGIREVGLFDLAVRTLATGEPQGMEYYYPHEGFCKWFACQFVKLGDGVVATNLDITERKTAEQERTRNLRLLEQAEAVAGLGSWDYDLATGTMRWSDGMYQLFGLPPGEAIHPRIYLEVVVPEDRDRAAQLVGRLGTAPGDFEETLRLRVGATVKTVRIKAVVLPDAQGRAARMLGVDLDISELQRLEADNLRLRLTQQQALFEAVQAAQEAERKRIAEGLHNGIGQILYATKLRLDRLRTPLLEADSALVAAHREANQLLGEAIGQTRALSHELVPMTLEEFGLAAALQDICRKMSSAQLRLHCLVQLDHEAAPLAPMLQMALYRMAQELAQNVAKHARGATEASLELETIPGWVLLRAEDNGAGFARAPAESAGLGLRSIRDRVALLGGQLESGAVPTGGAYVRIRIPLPIPSTP